jgi:hypothetical protein
LSLTRLRRVDLTDELLNWITKYEMIIVALTLIGVVRRRTIKDNSFISSVPTLLALVLYHCSCNPHPTLLRWFSTTVLVKFCAKV